MTEKEFIAQAKQLRQTALIKSRSMGADNDSAEDIAQDTLLKLWAAKDDITSPQHACALAATIAKHLAIDHYRRQKELPLGDNTPPSDHMASTCQSSASLSVPPDILLENNENERWLQERLKLLPSRQYEVLHLRQVEHKSLEEIAAITGITPGSAATLLARARQKLLSEIKRRNNT